MKCNSKPGTLIGRNTVLLTGSLSSSLREQALTSPMCLVRKAGFVNRVTARRARGLSPILLLCFWGTSVCLLLFPEHSEESRGRKRVTLSFLSPHPFSAQYLKHRLPWQLSSKESTCNARDMDLIPCSGRSPGGGHGNLLQYSCLENPHGQRSLAGYSPWVCKALDMTAVTKHASKTLYVLHKDKGEKISRLGQSGEPMSHGDDSKHVQTFLDSPSDRSKAYGPFS